MDKKDKKECEHDMEYIEKYWKLGHKVITCPICKKLIYIPYRYIESKSKDPIQELVRLWVEFGKYLQKPKKHYTTTDGVYDLEINNDAYVRTKFDLFMDWLARKKEETQC